MIVVALNVLDVAEPKSISVATHPQAVVPHHLEARVPPHHRRPRTLVLSLPMIPIARKSTRGCNFFLLILICN